MLIVAGNQVPVIPLVDVLVKISAELPLQIAFSGVKIGNIFSVMVCVRVVVIAHWFAAGVNV